MKKIVSKTNRKCFLKLLILFSILTMFPSVELYCQSSMQQYDGDYRAGHLRFKQIYSQNDYNGLDPNRLPPKKIDSQIIINSANKTISIRPTGSNDKWTVYRIVGVPKFERFMDDQGRETIISQFGAIDDLNQRCELGFSAWRSEVGAFRLIIHYPNKMFSAYDFVKASNWERTNWN